MHVCTKQKQHKSAEAVRTSEYHVTRDDADDAVVAAAAELTANILNATVTKRRRNYLTATQQLDLYPFMYVIYFRPSSCCAPTRW